MNIAYISGKNQESIEKQKYKLSNSNIDKWIIEEVKNKEKPLLKDMISRLKEGDTIFITDMARVSRDIKEVIEAIETVKTKGAAINILNSKIDVNSPEGKLAIISALHVIEELNKELE